MQGYWEAITMIEAQAALVKFTSADYPNMKKQDREKLHRSVTKQAYIPEDPKEISMEEFAQRLTRAING